MAILQAREDESEKNDKKNNLFGLAIFALAFAHKKG